MALFPIMTRSHRVALLGGVSLIALQGLSACAQKTPAPTTAYTPQVDAPVAPSYSGTTAGTYEQAGDGVATTLALGEEDGGVYAPDDSGMATTLALGEEDGTGPIPVEPDGGIGDGATPPPFATTLAIGEEDGNVYAPVDPGMATTLALGEEDGTGVIYDPPTVTTLAIGEEG